MDYAASTRNIAGNQIDGSTYTTAINANILGSRIDGSTYTAAINANIPSYKLDGSTYTAAINANVPMSRIDGSTYTSRINDLYTTKLSTGVPIPTNLIDLSTCASGGETGYFSSAKTLGSTLTVQGNAFSVGGSSFVVTASSVGIRNSNPAAALDVGGQIHASVYNAGTATTLNWNNGNVQYVSTGGVAGVMTLNNLYDGGAYTFITTDATGGKTSFVGNGLTFIFAPANAVRTVSKHTYYSLIRYGANVLVSWTNQP